MPGRRRFVLVFIAIATALALLGLGACDDDDGEVTTPPTPPALLTIEIDEYLLRAFSAEGTAFVSGPDGAVLDLATWSEAATLVFSMDATPPDTVSYTLVGIRSGAPLISTEIGVPAGTTISFDGGIAFNRTGDATITFANAPDCESYAIASNLDRAWGEGPLPASHDVPVYWGEVDVFVRLDPPGGWPVGAWQNAVHDGDDLTMDLGAPGRLAPLDRHAVFIPGSGDRLTANLYRHTRDGLEEQAVTFHFENFEGALPESVIMFAPDVDPADLECGFYMRTDGEPAESYGQTTRGVPAEFVEMAGELSIDLADVDSAAFTITGPWDRFSADWHWQANTRITWFVEGSAPLTRYALPQLPPEIRELPPDLAREEFFLQMLSVESAPAEGVERTKVLSLPYPDGAAADSAPPAPGYEPSSSKRLRATTRPPRR